MIFIHYWLSIIYQLYYAKKSGVMMHNYDITFVNKEITPFGGLSLFLKILENAILKSI